MGLRGQARVGRRGDRGYAMAALLVMVAVLTVLMSIAMPVWRHEAQREKEEELVFRGLQYVRAIRLYQAKTRALPPTIDALVQGHYLRKKYKDPITNGDFVPIGAAGAPGQVGQAGQPNQPGRGGRAGGGMTQPRPPQSQPSQFGPESGGAQGGIIGVLSKSTAESIRVYQGRTHYNEWPFVFVNAQPGGPGGPGGTPDGRGVPGGPGGRGRPGGPGGRGRNPGGEMGPRPNPSRGMPSPNPRPPGGPGHLP
jgi:type II secretory pathway pseudopilin PulG